MSLACGRPFALLPCDELSLPPPHLRDSDPIPLLRLRTPHPLPHRPRLLSPHRRLRHRMPPIEALRLRPQLPPPSAAAAPPASPRAAWPPPPPPPHFLFFVLGRPPWPPSSLSAAGLPPRQRPRHLQLLPTTSTSPADHSASVLLACHRSPSLAAAWCIRGRWRGWRWGRAAREVGRGGGGGGGGGGGWRGAGGRGW